MSSSPQLIPLHASPGTHVKIRCSKCHSPIEFFLRGGMNRLQCDHCRQTTEIEVVHNGEGWAARPNGKEQH
jgi:hypothetical protein